MIVCSLCVFLSMYLIVLCVLCLTVLMDSLLNAFAMCVGGLIVFSLIASYLCVVLVSCWLIHI